MELPSYPETGSAEEQQQFLIKHIVRVMGAMNAIDLAPGVRSQEQSERYQRLATLYASLDEKLTELQPLMFPLCSPTTPSEIPSQALTVSGQQEELHRALEKNWRSGWKSQQLTDKYKVWCHFKAVRKHRAWSDDTVWCHLLLVLPHDL